MNDFKQIKEKVAHWIYSEDPTFFGSCECGILITFKDHQIHLVPTFQSYDILKLCASLPLDWYIDKNSKEILFCSQCTPYSNTETMCFCFEFVFCEKYDNSTQSERKEEYTTYKKVGSWFAWIIDTVLMAKISLISKYSYQNNRNCIQY